MPLTQLRYFHEVARTGSIREASERLHVTPSSISRQIKNLEYEAGMPLFERRTRGMVLTAAGELYLSYARSVLFDLERLHSEIDELKGMRRGRVRIATIEGMVADTLLPAIARFRERYSGVSFHVTTMGTDLIPEAIQASEVDIGLAYNAEPNVDVRFAFKISDPLHAIVHHDHPLARLHQVSLAEALTCAVAVPEATFGIRRLIEQCCRAERLRLRPMLVTNSIEALRAFARTGAGLTMLPLLSICADHERGAVAAVPFKEVTLRRSSVDICVAADRKLPVAAEAFLVHFQHFCAEIGRLRYGQAAGVESK